MSTRRGECPQPKISPAGHVCAGAGRTLAGLPPKTLNLQSVQPITSKALNGSKILLGQRLVHSHTRRESLLFCAITKQTMIKQDGDRRTRGPWALLCGCARRVRLLLSYLLCTCPSSGLSAKQASKRKKEGVSHYVHLPSLLPYIPSCVRTCFLYMLQGTKNDGQTPTSKDGSAILLAHKATRGLS